VATGDNVRPLVPHSIEPYSIFYTNAFSKNAGRPDPTVNSTAIIAYLESFAVDSLHEVKIFGTPHLTKHNVSDRESRASNRRDSAELARFYAALH
jgi:hypothetical protein